MRIFLTGLMGSGKSYWMRRLGAKLHVEHFDLDELVTEREQQSVTEIFDRSGEARFREIESEVLRQMEEQPGFILATGGGTPCFHDNMYWMNQSGFTIWLDESTDVLVERLMPERSHRPLIATFNKDQLRSYLETSKKERQPFYSQAKIILQGEAINEENLVMLIKQHSNA